MRMRHRLSLLLASLLVLIGGLGVPAGAAPDAPAPPPGPTEAVAYQISVSHDGYSGDGALAPPLTSRWSRDLPGPVSYPLIAAGKVFEIGRAHV